MHYALIFIDRRAFDKPADIVSECVPPGWGAGCAFVGGGAINGACAIDGTGEWRCGGTDSRGCSSGAESQARRQDRRNVSDNQRRDDTPELQDDEQQLAQRVDIQQRLGFGAFATHNKEWRNRQDAGPG